MSSGNRVMLESLESRTFFAVTPTPTVQADIAQVQADVQQLRTDQANGASLINTDRAAIANAVAASRANVTALVGKLRSDVQAFALQFRQINASLASTLRSDTATIRTHLLRLRVDQGNRALVAADLATLAADRASVFGHRAQARAALLTALSNRQGVLRADLTAIANARLSDPNVKAAQDKLISDSLAIRQTLSADLLKLAQDRAKLATDIRAGN